jgi:hypothetical protein
MREIRPSGSLEAVISNGHSYSDFQWGYRSSVSNCRVTLLQTRYGYTTTSVVSIELGAVPSLLTENKAISIT